MSDSDFESLRALLNERFDALERHLTTRLEAVDERRKHGDRSLAQRSQFIEEQQSKFTKEIGGLDAKMERVEKDTNRALASHREELRDMLHEEVSRITTQLKDSLAERDQKRDLLESRVASVEDRLNAVKWAALGVGVGSGITSGSVVAVLTGALGDPTSALAGVVFWLSGSAL